MENGRKLLRGIALAAIAVIGLGGIALFASPSLAAQTRPDVIRIDAMLLRSQQYGTAPYRNRHQGAGSQVH